MITQTNNSDYIVCASAGNHAQGVAFACNLLNKNGIIYLPETTPKQKINRIKYYGKDNIILKITGDNFSQTLSQSLEFSEKNNYQFIHPYNDYKVIEGQSTIMKEIIEDLDFYPDIISCCVGGGGLVSGITSYLNELNKESNYKIKIIGNEPENADSLNQALLKGYPVEINNIDNFVDGASVKKIGDINFDILHKNLTSDNVNVISKGKICQELLNLYQEEGIVLEPAGVLSVCGLEYLDKNDIKGKNIVCVLSGGNNDILRYPEIIEIYNRYINIKHYYIIEFSQKPNELKKFILNVLGNEDDITRFEYIKKTNKTFGNVLVGIETKNYKNIENNLEKYNFKYSKIEEDDLIYSYLI